MFIIRGNTVYKIVYLDNEIHESPIILTSYGRVSTDNQLPILTGRQEHMLSYNINKNISFYFNILLLIFKHDIIYG